MNTHAVLGVVTFVDLLQTDDVSVVPGQLLLDQVLSVVQLQGIGGTVRVKHRLGQFCLCVDISEDVVGHHPHNRPLHFFYSINVSVVKRAHTRSSLHSPHRHQLLGQTTTTPIPRCAEKFEPVANVLVGWDVDSSTSYPSPTYTFTWDFPTSFRTETKWRKRTILGT